MSTERWAVIGGGQTFVMQGRALTETQDTTDMSIVRVGEGAPTKLPAPILPDHGTSLAAFTQETPADVISGWVRLWIVGFLSGHAPWDGVVCALHGDVSHWIHLSAGKAVSSQSFLTPRLLVALGGGQTADAHAITDSLSRPERLAAQLRVAEVSGQSSAITGHLIGAELAAAQPYWLGQQAAVIGEGTLNVPYTDALSAQGCPTSSHDSADLIQPALTTLGVALGLVS